MSWVNDQKQDFRLKIILLQAIDDIYCVLKGIPLGGCQAKNSDNKNQLSQTIKSAKIRRLS